MVVWKFHDGFRLFFMAALFLTSFRFYHAVQGFGVCDDDDDDVISSWFVVAPTCMQVRCEVTLWGAWVHHGLKTLHASFTIIVSGTSWKECISEAQLC